MDVGVLRGPGTSFPWVPRVVNFFESQSICRFLTVGGLPPWGGGIVEGSTIVSFPNWLFGFRRKKAGLVVCCPITNTTSGGNA